MICPRCDTEMKQVMLRNIPVDLCPNCEGSWYDADELAAILETPLQELESSDLAPVLVADKLDKIDTEKNLDCPRCGEPMVRYQYLITSDIYLDECPDHGIWLDDGELTKMLEFLGEWDDAGQEKRAEIERVRQQGNYQVLTEENPSWHNVPGQFLKLLNKVFRRKR
ncbi:MAG: zf-TFIIB domain-containing protein [Candidatus Eremiobacteraeota bacterium]|nr:zf-TFIIB domain-containing protein [Candidatus Eremiobacteraeota bacterium]